MKKAGCHIVYVGMESINPNSLKSMKKQQTVEEMARVTRENRIQFNDWALYDAHHAVFKPKRLSLFELQQAQIFSHSKFYSFIEVIRRAMSFAWVEFAIAVYARKLNRLWQKKNKTFLRVMDLCRPEKNETILIDYRERVRFEDEVSELVV